MSLTCCPHHPITAAKHTSIRSKIAVTEMRKSYVKANLRTLTFVEGIRVGLLYLEVCTARTASPRHRRLAARCVAGKCKV